MQKIAELLQVELEEVDSDLDRKKKGDAEKIRRMNKRNAIKVAQAAFDRAKDAVGLEAMEKYRDKKDDVADAMLLAFGSAMGSQSKRKPKAPPKKRSQATARVSSPLPFKKRFTQKTLT
jgi:hypothetical protein